MPSSSITGDDHFSVQPLQSFLDLISGVLSLLLVNTASAKVFVGRFRVLRANLEALQSSLTSVSSSAYWTQNPLLHTLLPSLLSTLQRLQALSLQCVAQPFPSFPTGKLHFQSDLDMAASSLSSHLHDLDLLLHSGVLNHANAIVLSHPVSGSDSEHWSFFIKDLFTRLELGGVEFKMKALESLLHVLQEEGNAGDMIAQENRLGYLISLLDLNSHHNVCVRELAVSVVSTLATSGNESRKAVFELGGLGPLLKTLETGTMALKEKAAIAVEAITSDPENAWAISAYSGVPGLIEACRSGSPPTQLAAVGAISNVLLSDDVKMAIAEEEAIPVFLHLLSSTDISTQQKATNCLYIMASSGENFRRLITHGRGVQKLMQCFLESSSFNCAEHFLRAIVCLSSSDAVARVLSSSTTFVIRLGDLITQGNPTLQQTSTTLLANLSISDGNKRAICGCMSSLVKLMDARKPTGLSETASLALLSLLTVKFNCKEFAREEKNLLRLVQMLDPKIETVSKVAPVAVVSALLVSSGCRKRLVAAGARPYLLQLSEADVPCAKKAAKKLAGNRIKSIIFSRSWTERT